jgi:hypothetical protein
MTDMSDERSRRRLHALLWVAGSRLQRLGPQPAAIACATDKFNDAQTDDFWCAVRVDGYFWEQSQFFGNYALEQARGPMDEGGEGTAKLQTHSFDAARTMLDDLERAGWRTLAEQAFGQRANGQIFALVYQLDQLWLHISHPMNAQGEFYAVLRNHMALVASVVDRMDDLINKPNLLPVHELKPDALPFLSDTARRHFHPRLASTAAALELRELLVTVAKSIRSETPEVVVISLRPATFKERRRGFPNTGMYYGPDFQVRNVHYTVRSYQDLQTRPMKEEVRARFLASYEIADFAKLDSIVRALDEVYPRGLFEAAFDTETFGNEKLLFAIVRDELYLLHDTKLFVVGRETKLLGRGAVGTDSPPIEFVGYAHMDKLDLHSSQPFGGFDLNNRECVSAINVEH